jgi:hypothetical protein
MERELDEAANRTAYFLAVHSGKLGFVRRLPTRLFIARPSI